MPRVPAQRRVGIQRDGLYKPSRDYAASQQSEPAVPPNLPELAPSLDSQWLENRPRSIRRRMPLRVPCPKCGLQSWMRREYSSQLANFRVNQKLMAQMPGCCPCRKCRPLDSFHAPNQQMQRGHTCRMVHSLQNRAGRLRLRPSIGLRHWPSPDQLPRARHYY